MIDKEYLEHLSTYLSGMLQGVLAGEDRGLKFTLVLSYPTGDKKLGSSVINNFKDSKVAMGILEGLVKSYKAGDCKESLLPGLNKDKVS